MSSSAVTFPSYLDPTKAADGSASQPSFSFANSTGTGFYRVSANTLGISTAGVQRVVVDSAGNVGIGTASPANALHVNTAQANLRLESSVGTNNAVMRCINTGGTAYIGLDNSSGGLGAAYGLHLFHSGAYPIVFSTNNIERMRLDASGNLLVGTTSSPGYHSLAKSHNDWAASIQNGHASSPFGLLVRYTGSAPNSGSNNFFLCLDTSTTRMNVYANGGIANYQGNNINLSDRREKTEFSPAKSYLDVICQIPIQTFKYIDQTDEEKTLGVIAQDVQAVAPELVSEDNWGTEEEPKTRLAIYQTDLQYALMKCIQELKEKNDALEARLAALESK